MMMHGKLGALHQQQLPQQRLQCQQLLQQVLVVVVSVLLEDTSGANSMQGVGEQVADIQTSRSPAQLGSK